MTMSVSKYTLMLLSLSMLFGAAALAAPAQLIVPGQGIGPIPIGMPLSRLKELLTKAGSPPEEARLKDGIALCFGLRKGNEPPIERYLLHGGVCAFDFTRDARQVVRTPGEVAEIATANTQFKTREGLGPGSGVAAFRTVLGVPSWVGTMRVDEGTVKGESTIMGWEKRGIGLVTASKTVAEIVFVFRPTR